MKILKEKQPQAEKSECLTVRVKFFYVKTSKPDEFVDELEQLCKKYCPLDDFFFNYSVED
ncbi:MAG: hypothetical protein ABR958_08730 [Dehalococcoidales bacterium]